uniref:Transposase n=1 Tax=Romanomermis culicivorax TaxID=13658 RepID=A0A915KZG3_ROMCU
ECIWNVDETELSTDAGCSKALCAKGVQNAHRIVAGEGRLMFTIVGCGNATGGSVPLLLVYGGKNLWDDWCLGRLESFHFTVRK